MTENKYTSIEGVNEDRMFWSILNEQCSLEGVDVVSEDDFNE